MSTEAPNVWSLMRTIRSSDLDPASKILLLEIMDRAGNGRGACTASAETLAKGVGFSPRYVKTLIRGLKEARWIVVERSGPSPNSPRRRITLAPRASLISTKTHESDCDPQITPEISPTVIHRSPHCDPQITPTVIPRSHKRLSERQQETSVDGQDGEEHSWKTGGGDPEGTRRPLDKATVTMLAVRCPHLPHGTAEKLARRGNLAERIDGDWLSLALAVVKTEVGRASGEINVAIKTPVAYLVKVASSIRGGEDPGAKVRARLQAMLDGKPESEAGNSEPEGRVVRAMNVGLMRHDMRRQWSELADGGLSVYGIESAIEAEVRGTNETLGLHGWQAEKRLDVMRRFLASMRAPEGMECMDDDGGEPFTDQPLIA